MEKDTHTYEMKDPASRYASADALDPNAPMNQERGDGWNEERRDPLNSYASADELGPAPEAPTEPHAAAHQDPVRDGMSGYMSADVLDANTGEESASQGGRTR